MSADDRNESTGELAGPWQWWSPWVELMTRWQAAWLSALGAWPGVNGTRPTLPLLWDPGLLMPRVDARITPVVSEQGNEAARVSMLVRMPRFGCVGPADLVAVEAFVARRPDPGLLPAEVHPGQGVPPLPAPGSVPAARKPIAETLAGPAAKANKAAKVGRTTRVGKPTKA